jgi:putative ABC transport system permease protein
MSGILNFLTKSLSRILRAICPDELWECVEGDLLEQFESDCSSVGENRAKARLIFNMIKFIRPGIICRNRISFNAQKIVMIESYFKISLRYLSKHKTFTAVNVIGLALGMSAALLISQFVTFERSFDAFHESADNLYRVTTLWNKEQTPNDHRARTMPWSGPAVKDAFPEVVDYTRLTDIKVFTGFNAIEYKNVLVNNQRIFLADPGFLRMFSFPLLKGNANTALNDPTSIVITESSAKKFFKEEDPMGKELILDSHNNLPESTFKVTGVIKDPPANSHLKFDFLISFKIVFEGLHNGSTYWHWDYTYCYLQLHPDVDVALLEKKMSELRVRQFEHEMQYYSDKVDFKLQPVKSIHLNSSLAGELSTNNHTNAVSFLFIIGITILLCAYINYVNLSTVKAVERRIEIGVRKVVGSSRRQLIGQLMVESFLLNALSFLVAIGICVIAIPLLEDGFNIQWPAFSIESISVINILTLSLIFISGVVLSVAYPAFVLTSFKPAQVLRGPGTFHFSRGLGLRKSLTVFQFVFCIAFSMGTYALYKQLFHMRHYDLGMNLDQVLVVKGYGFQPFKAFTDFKSSLASNAGIQSIGISSVSPGDEVIELSLKPKVSVTGQSSMPKEMKLATIDDDFFTTLNIEFLAGKNFDMRKQDKSVVIINEAAATLLGYKADSIVNETLSGLQQVDPKVIGVIKNYNQRSLKTHYEPMVYFPIWNTDFGWNDRFYFIRFSPSMTAAAYQEKLAHVEKSWRMVNPEKPFDYYFLDTYFNDQYKGEDTVATLFLFFAGFAISIAALGLLGLVAYTTLQRTKEIGIRKVFGATVNSILMLLSKDLLKLILISAMITVPLVALSMDEWLNQYAFRIEITAGLLFLPLIVIFVISLLTVLVKSVNVATSNPIESLKHE